MKLPLRITYFLKIPYFELLFETEFDGYAQDFVTYFNSITKTTFDKNLTLFLETAAAQEDAFKKVIIYNLGVFYFNYIKTQECNRIEYRHQFLVWNDDFKETLPAYNEAYSGYVLVNPYWNKQTESYEDYLITEPNVHQYISSGLQLLFMDKAIPTTLAPAFCLSILIAYYTFKTEIDDLKLFTDPTAPIL